MSKKKIHPLRSTTKLWGAIRVVGWIYIVLALLMAISFGRMALSLTAFASADYISEDDIYANSDLTGTLLLFAGLPFIIVYLIGAFLVLRWYLRSLRNANRLHPAFQTSPGWAIWGFIIPVVSLVKPYGMTSELWRSSLKPEGWRGLKDPSLLRLWWGVVLAASFGSTIGDISSRTASTVQQIQISYGISALAFLLLAVAGLLFLRIGGPISRRQTALIEAGYEAAPSSVPRWSS